MYKIQLGRGKVYQLKILPTFFVFFPRIELGMINSIKKQPPARVIPNEVRRGEEILCQKMSLLIGHFLSQD